MKLSTDLRKQKLGSKGEQLATKFLQNKGYRIIARNFKARYGELDIIALQNATLVVIEVKTRIGNQYGSPEEAITPRKLHEVTKTFEYFILLHPEFEPFPLRIDLVAILLNEEEQLLSLNHIENISGF